MASAGHRRGAIIEGINVTPLVDVTLVLLVIFIVTAKVVVTPAVPLDLPAAAAREDVQTVLSVVLPATGPMQIDGATASERDLEARAQTALAQDRETRAIIQADRAVPHGRVMAVLDVLRHAGLTRVGFGAAAPSEGDGPPIERPGAAGAR